MAQICRNRIRLKDRGLTVCGGEIIEVEGLENGRLIRDLACKECGHSPSLEPLVIHDPLAGLRADRVLP